eukprot:4498591-Prymnesium_polylepis.1
MAGGAGGAGVPICGLAEPIRHSLSFGTAAATPHEHLLSIVVRARRRLELAHALLVAHDERLQQVERDGHELGVLDHAVCVDVCLAHEPLQLLVVQLKNLRVKAPQDRAKLGQAEHTVVVRVALGEGAADEMLQRAWVGERGRERRRATGPRFCRDDALLAACRRLSSLDTSEG